MAVKKTTKKPTVKKAPVAKPAGGTMFDMLNDFWNPKKFESYSNYERGKNYFILQRRFAINYPEMAAALSKVGINTGQVIKFWQQLITKQIPGSPGWGHWLYTKSAKGKTESTTKQYKPSTETIAEYCKFYECDSKDVAEALKMFPEEMTKELKEIENMMT